MSAETDAAVCRLHEAGDSIKGGQSNGFILISLDRKNLPEYTIYTRGNGAIRLSMIGALHEVIAMVLSSEQEAATSSQMN